MSEKPFKGNIHNWRRIEMPDAQFAAMVDAGESPGLGYVVAGEPDGHPDFHGWMRPSYIVKHNEETGEIETRNSRYKLIGPENRSGEK